MCPLLDGPTLCIDRPRREITMGVLQQKTQAGRHDAEPGKAGIRMRSLTPSQYECQLL
jgi:hypothetical protein